MVKIILLLFMECQKLQSMLRIVLLELGATTRMRLDMNDTAVEGLNSNLNHLNVFSKNSVNVHLRLIQLTALMATEITLSVMFAGQQNWNRCIIVI